MSGLAPFARAVCDGVRGAGSRHVVYVPDNPLGRWSAASRPMCEPSSATREEEAVGLAAGLDALAAARREPGPRVIVAEVAASSPTAGPPLDCVFLRLPFMAAIGIPEAATRGAQP